MEANERIEPDESIYKDLPAASREARPPSPRARRTPRGGGGDLCTRCGGQIDHDDPHMYCSKCT